MTKKLFALIATLSLMIVGLVSASGGAAQATHCPYTGCFQTATKLFGQTHWPPRSRPTLKVKVTAFGNATPRGNVVFKVRKKGGGYFRQKTVWYAGSPRFVTLPRLDGRGRYRVVAIYRPGPRPFYSSRDTKILRVP